jgi:hypothetical protein
MGKPAETTEPKPLAKTTWDDFQALVKRAENGDKSVLPRIRETLKSGDNPDWSRWFHETFGNPSKWLSGTLSGMADKNNLAVIEASQAKLTSLRKELEGPNPTPIERMLVERAVHCWFIVNVYETFYIQSTDLSIKQADFQVRRIDAAHKRFLSSVATLARVRKLALPSLQVNIGAAQVNVGKPG